MGAGSRKKRWLRVLAVLVLAAVSFWVIAVNTSELRARYTIVEFQVPASFTGWLTLKFAVPEAPPLPFAPGKIGGTYRVRFPSDGYVETSSPMLTQRYTEKYFRAERGGAVLIGWDPPPFFLREQRTSRCWMIFVPDSELSSNHDVPPAPEHGCQ